jgi:hypothetical protein
MKKKIFALSCLLLFLLMGSYNIQAQETINAPRFNKMSLAHVSIIGSGTELILGGSFIWGFGNCILMRVNLEEDGHVEINKFLDPSDVIILDGCHVIYLIGFFGYNRHVNKIILDGVALQVIWV